MLQETIVENFAKGIIAINPQDIPTHVKHMAALLFIDSAGVAIGNKSQNYILSLYKALNIEPESGPCSIIGHKNKVKPQDAAILNSSLIHGTDFDATHLEAIMHPTAVIIPVALAAAEKIDATGCDFLSAVTLGSEILVRLGLATNGGLHKSGFQSTALLGPIAGVLTLGRLFGFSPQHIVHAAGLAGCLSSGLRSFSDDGTWGKRIITGWACNVSLMAASLAQHEWPGTRDILEKPWGLYSAFMSTNDLDLSKIDEDFGERWYLLDTEIKKYPCSHGHHSFIDSAIIASQTIKAKDIVSVNIEVTSEAKKWWFDGKYNLVNLYAARFSLPYTIASALLYGGLKESDLDTSSLSNPSLQKMVQCIKPKIIQVPEYINPVQLPGVIEIKTVTGERIRIDGKNKPKKKLDEIVKQKFIDNSIDYLENKKIEELFTASLELEKTKKIRDLTKIWSIGENNNE